MNGHLAVYHAEMEKNLVQDQLPLLHQMEDKIVKEKLQNPKLVMREIARSSTVNGDLMEIGHLAQHHVEKEKKLVQGQWP